MQNQDTIKKQADDIQVFLKEHGCKLGRGKVFDLLAKLCGDKDWNTLSARLKNTAPGVPVPRFRDILQRIKGTLSIAKDSLDDASTVVDAGEDEAFAYEAELELIEAEMQRVDALLSAEKPFKLEGVALVFYKSCEADAAPLSFLLPPGVDVEGFEARMSSWTEKLRKEIQAASDSDEDDANVYARWTREGAIAEAIRWGAVCPEAVVMKGRWDD